MLQSLLCIVLGLLASTSGENDINVYMCEHFNVCRNLPTTVDPPVASVTPVASFAPVTAVAPVTTVAPVTPVGNNCTCVRHDLCGKADHGEDVIDLRTQFDGCSDYLEKCCKNEDIRSPTATPIPAVSTKCGVRNHSGVGFRHVNGADNETQYAEFPWVVGVVGQGRAMSTDGSSSSAYLCGGSLIHPQAVLTAAHCVKGGVNLMVVAGEWDTQTKNEPYPTQMRKVRKVILHEELEERAALNDVALLILEQPFNTKVPNVNTICLPDPNENMDGRNCIASGWGKDVFGNKGKYQAILKKVDDLPMVPRSRCLELLRETRLGPRFKLHESFVCAGGIKGKDTCQGDGGGPLVCPKRNNAEEYVQAGIVAWGIGCNTETPGVYVDVARFVNWIDNKLQAEDISHDS